MRPVPLCRGDFPAAPSGAWQAWGPCRTHLLTEPLLCEPGGASVSSSAAWVLSGLNKPALRPRSTGRCRVASRAQPPSRAACGSRFNQYHHSPPHCPTAGPTLVPTRRCQAPLPGVRLSAFSRPRCTGGPPPLHRVGSGHSPVAPAVYQRGQSSNSAGPQHPKWPLCPGRPVLSLCPSPAELSLHAEPCTLEVKPLV